MRPAGTDGGYAPGRCAKRRRAGAGPPPTIGPMARFSPAGWVRGLSLANKCLLLFGGAVVLIVGAALVAPGLRMNTLVSERQAEIARRLVNVWQQLDAQARQEGRSPAPDARGVVDYAGIRARWLPTPEARTLAATDRALGSVLRRFEGDPRATEDMLSRWDGATRVYRYLRAARAVPPEGGTPVLEGVIELERRSDDTAVLLIVNTVYLLSAGVVVLVLALAVFYFVTHKVVLGPVRSLKETAEKVRADDLAIRSDIRTGDEFEELALTFNQMLESLQAAEEQQRANYRALNVKVDELSAANSALYEANKLKAEFLANVSHELRTPMNSIIGFTELLLEIVENDRLAKGESADLARRNRYISNINRAGKDLLALIETLLSLAKIEAGRVDLRLEALNVRETLETLAALIHPQASEKGADVVVEAAPDLPPLRTDAQRFQQIIFNFLSNSVKFIEPSDRTGRRERITIRAESLPARGDGERDSVRVSVIDTGPGIAPEHHARIFEKFYQVEGGHTRGHQGSGLGLAICKDLAALLGGEIQLVSDVGRGSMFSLILPREPQQAREPAKR